MRRKKSLHLMSRIMVIVLVVSYSLGATPKNATESAGSSIIPEMSVLSENPEWSVSGAGPESRQDKKEQTELRTANSKTYPGETSDQSICVVSTEDIHYKDAKGQWQEISNKIILDAKSVKDMNYLYANEANNFTVRFADAKSPYQMILEYGSYSIAFGLKDSKTRKVAVSPSIKDTILSKVLIEDSHIVYNDVYDNVDLIYQVISSGIKEYIVLHQATEQTEFYFPFVLEGLDYENTKNGVVFKNEKGEEIFTMGDLYAVDSANAFTDKVQCSVVPHPDSKEPVLKLTVDKDYLQSPDRVFPIVIDPPVMVTGPEKTQDTFVSHMISGGLFANSPELKTGWDSTYETCRTFIRFTLPTTIPATHVSNVSLNLKKSAGTAPQIRAYYINKPTTWSATSMSWPTQPYFIADDKSAVAVISTGSWWSMNVTAMTRKMMAGTYVKNGYAIISDVETSPASMTMFYSSEAPSPHKPELVITYSDGPVATLTPTPHPTVTPTPKPVVIPLQSFKLNKTTLSMNLNKTATLSPSGYIPANTTSTKIATWRTSNSTVVALTGNGGQIKAKKVGTAIITCTIDGISVTCTVTVVAVPLVSFDLHKSTLSMQRGKTATLSVINVVPSNTTSSMVSSWSSSNPSIVEMTGNASGQIRAKAIGTAIITCTIDGKFARCTVTVTAPPATPTPTPTPTQTPIVLTIPIHVYCATGSSFNYQQAFTTANEYFNQKFGINFRVDLTTFTQELLPRAVNDVYCTYANNVICNDVHCGEGCDNADINDIKHHKSAKYYATLFPSYTQNGVFFVDFFLCGYFGDHQQILGRAMPRNQFEPRVAVSTINERAVELTLMHELSHWLGAVDDECDGRCVVNDEDVGYDWCWKCEETIRENMDNPACIVDRDA